MKKIILATTIVVAFTATSFAKGIDPISVEELTNAVKNKCDVQWTKTDKYSQASFHFKGKDVCAFYDLEDESLIGFSIPLNKADFSPSFVRAIKQKYVGWTVVDAIMFIDAKGASNYFYLLQKDSNNLVVKAGRNGRVRVVSKIS